MKVSEAIQMIRNGVIRDELPSAWADLGCGSGLFTMALAQLLPEKSMVFAIDKKMQSFPAIKNTAVKIEFMQADFIIDELVVSPLNGILMANSLHYVKDKNLVLNKLLKLFKGEGQFIIIEYEIKHANPWVPYPIGFLNLTELFIQHGFGKVDKLAEKKSIYQSGTIYSAAVYRK